MHADCDLGAGCSAKRWFDSVGHYSRSRRAAGQDRAPTRDDSSDGRARTRSADVVAGLEAGRWSAAITPISRQPLLEVGERLLVGEVVALDQQLDAATEHPEAAVALALDRVAALAHRPVDAVLDLELGPPPASQPLRQIRDPGQRRRLLRQLGEDRARAARRGPRRSPRRRRARRAPASPSRSPHSATSRSTSSAGSRSRFESTTSSGSRSRPAP